MGVALAGPLSKLLLPSAAADVGVAAWAHPGGRPLPPPSPPGRRPTGEVALLPPWELAGERWPASMCKCPTSRRWRPGALPSQPPPAGPAAPGASAADTGLALSPLASCVQASPAPSACCNGSPWLGAEGSPDASLAQQASRPALVPAPRSPSSSPSHPSPADAERAGVAAAAASTAQAAARAGGVLASEQSAACAGSAAPASSGVAAPEESAPPKAWGGDDREGAAGGVAGGQLSRCAACAASRACERSPGPEQAVHVAGLRPGRQPHQPGSPCSSWPPRWPLSSCSRAIS